MTTDDSDAAAPTDPGHAQLGRRVLALAIDWAACNLIAFGLIARVWDMPPEWRSFGPLVVLLVENALLVALAGGTLGHRLIGLGVVAPGRARPTLVQSTIRAVLLCLLVPAVVMDGNGRGLHDAAAGTSIRRLRFVRPA